MRIQVNAEVQSASGFPLWAEATYLLRITEVEQTTASTGKAQLKVRLTPINNVQDDSGVPLSAPGTLMDWVTVDPIQTKGGGTVSFLRGLWEAAGLTWNAEIDTDDLMGKEVSARVAIEKDQRGNDRNRVKRYVKAS